MIGLQVNDVLYQMEDVMIESMDDVGKIVRSNLGTEIDITLIRDEEFVHESITPRATYPDTEGPMGIVMTNPIQDISFIQSIPMATYVTYEQTKQIITLPAMLISGVVSPQEARFLGPVGIYSLYENARSADAELAQSPEDEGGGYTLINTIGLMGTLSIAFFITNLLPLPALDGGRILLALPEIVIRRKVPQQYENYINAIGFFLLIGLMIFITAQDIFNPIQLP